jgi:acetyltransferase-like isoleucine patch superfamily enzyme
MPNPVACGYGMKYRTSLRWAVANRRVAPLELLRLQRRLLSLAYARFYYWFFLKLFFGSHIKLTGKAGARIHPSTHLVMHNSRIIVENGVLSVGYLPGWANRDNSNIRLFNSTLHIRGNVDLRPGVEIWAMNATVAIGNGTVINGQTSIVSKAGVRIGAQCHIAKNTTIMDCDLHKHGVPGQNPRDIAKEVIIKDHCWVGQYVAILKGVTVGEGSIIGAHSVVTEDVEAHTIVAGVPARKVKENIIWEP